MPRILATVADAVVPLAERKLLVGSFVEEIAGFAPNEDLVARLASVPLPYANLLIRPGLSPERMRELAKRLRRYVAIDGEDEGSRQDRARKGRRGVPARHTLKEAAAVPPSRPERLE